MLQKLRQSKREEGFTIIEVLIVLAIAGLILLIVFLAVPALQRNSRNTQRKDDASAILSGLSEYVGNNSGTLPTACSGSSTTVTWGATGTAQNDTKMGYYNGGCVTSSPTNGKVYLNTTSGTVAALSSSTQDYIEVVTGDVCSGNGAAAGSARQTAILYEIETSGGYTGQCEQS
ncbi:MAG TPA: type II secretion system protein [Candidatus Saccharimonadales bacterium]